MKTTIKVPIDIARRGDDRAREIFDAAANFGKTFNECLGEVYMTGIMAGAASGCGVHTQDTTQPDWWTEAGEREDARRLSSRLRHFIADSRLLAPTELRTLEVAQITLEAHLAAR